jgi:hypothetical protein
VAVLVRGGLQAACPHGEENRPSEQRDVFTSNAGSVAIAATSRYAAESTTASSPPFPSPPPSSSARPAPRVGPSEFTELTRRTFQI